MLRTYPPVALREALANAFGTVRMLSAQADESSDANNARGVLRRLPGR